MNNLNNQDPNRHIPSAAETGLVDKFAKQFRSRHVTFSDAEGENIVIFARNADNFMRQHLIPSLEMGMIIIHNLKGEPYTRAKRWRDTMDIDPERVNADHCTEVRFSTFFSGGFIAAIVVNLPERKLAKRTFVHWREQDFQAATPFMPFQPMQLAQELIMQRPTGVNVNGQPDANDPGHPGREMVKLSYLVKLSS